MHTLFCIEQYLSVCSWDIRKYPSPKMLTSRAGTPTPRVTLITCSGNSSRWCRVSGGGSSGSSSNSSIIVVIETVVIIVVVVAVVVVIVVVVVLVVVVVVVIVVL